MPSSSAHEEQFFMASKLVHERMLVGGHDRRTALTRKRKYVLTARDKPYT